MNDEEIIKNFNGMAEKYEKAVSKIDMGRTPERHQDDVRFYIELYKVMGLDYSRLEGELDGKE